MEPEGVSAADQVRALAEGAGLLRRGRGRIVRVVGADRVEFLHRMLTQDVAGIPPGGAAYACVLDARGRVLGDPVVWNVGDAILLDLCDGAASSAVPHLERYVISEDVAFEDVSTQVRRFALAGPRLSDVLARVECELPPPGRHVTMDGDGWRARVLRFDLGARPACEWIVTPSGMEGAFTAALVGAAATVVGPGAWDIARVEERVPMWAAEITPDVMALEPRLGDVAISWTKGCYPGQEPVSKARHLGHPPNLLVRLELSGPALPGRGLLHEGRRVGRLTTTVVDPRDVRARALGFVRYALARPDCVLAMSGGGQARVLDAA